MWQSWAWIPPTCLPDIPAQWNDVKNGINLNKETAFTSFKRKKHEELWGERPDDIEDYDSIKDGHLLVLSKMNNAS